VTNAGAHSPSSRHLGPRVRGDDSFNFDGDALKQRVLEILGHVPDPEIPCVSVVDLGIVRAVREDTVVITPPYSGCPATLAIARDIRKALDDAGLAKMKIETVL